MINTEQVTIRNCEYLRTWSNEGRYVVRNGVSYTEAVDPLGSGRTYTEGELIPPEVVEATTEDYRAALAEMGVRLGGD